MSDFDPGNDLDLDDDDDTVYVSATLLDRLAAVVERLDNTPGLYQPAVLLDVADAARRLIKSLP